MKILISESPPRWLDLGAPTVTAHVVSIGGRKYWRVLCPHCGDHHVHDPGTGHRYAHCIVTVPTVLGYNLAIARRPLSDLLAEIDATPEADRGPLLEELDAHKHDAGEEMFGPQE